MDFAISAIILYGALTLPVLLIMFIASMVSSNQGDRP